MLFLRMTVFKLDWWLHLVGGGALAAGGACALPWPAWPALVIAIYLLGEAREVQQQIASFEFSLWPFDGGEGEDKMVQPFIAPGDPYRYEPYKAFGESLGLKRRHEALAWLWGALLGVWAGLA